MRIDFSIITPSYNMLNYLKRCSASVVDQNVSLEHIVVDAVSTDGTIEWLKRNGKIISIIEKDNGMYEAINKGIKKSRGKYIGYLNCDEQYLLGTLETAKEHFERYPGIDIVFGNKLNVYPDGRLNSYKKTIRLRKYYVLASNLYIPSCTVFFRNKIFKQGYYFDTKYKSCGDAEFLVRLSQNGLKFLHINRFMSVFTISGHNLSQREEVLHERKRFVDKYTKLPPLFLKVFNWLKYCEKLVSGAYFQRFPIEYSIYTDDNTDDRKDYKFAKGSFRTKWAL